jgi:uncharacterized protein YndB with AHSA1/START domain
MPESTKKEQETISISRSIWINAPVEKAWEAVSNSEMLTKWYSPGSIWKIPDLKEGATAEFHLMTYYEDPQAEKTLLTAKIEKAELNKTLSFRWNENPSFPGMLLVTNFVLEEENGGTKVTIYETGYETVREEERQMWLDGVGEGYTAALENLKSLIEKGEILHQ